MATTGNFRRSYRYYTRCCMGSQLRQVRECLLLLHLYLTHTNIRSYQLIATACNDCHVRIFKLIPESSMDDTPGGSQPSTPAPTTPQAATSTNRGKKYRVELVADFADHEASVWRVEWNTIGTVLASTGDDGRLMLWKGRISHFLFSR